MHAPLTAATRHLLGPAELAQMKPGVVLINTGRGALLDTQAALFGKLKYTQATRSPTRPHVAAWGFSLVFYLLAYALRSSPAVMVPELARAPGVSARDAQGILGTYHVYAAGSVAAPQKQSAGAGLPC